MPEAVDVLADQVRRALRMAGFQLIDAADAAGPGLQVRPALAGVLVSWTTSHGFTSLADQTRDPDLSGDTASDALGAMVQTAVSSLLVQLGHTVTHTPDGTGTLVLANDSLRTTF